jgi:hypothetical protein
MQFRPFEEFMQLATSRAPVPAEVPVLTGIDPLPASELFGKEARSEKTFGGKLGLRQGPAFSAQEVERIKAIIKERLLYNARNLSASAADDLESIELEDYHTISDHYPHAKMLCKTGRILSGDAVREIKSMSFFEYVRSGFGDSYYLSDEDNIGHEQICCRIVRPHRLEDVGSLHRDSWFWDYYEWPVPKGLNRTKIWVPISGDPNLSGLLLAPGSHRCETPFKAQIEEGKVVFLPEFDTPRASLQRYAGAAGSPIMFNYDLLHVGAVNRSEKSRASIEFTVMYS